MVKVNYTENPADFSLCKEMFEKLAFPLDDSLLIDYESVMHSTKTRTDIIALEDSEVIVILAIL